MSACARRVGSLNREGWGDVLMAFEVMDVSLLEVCLTYLGWLWNAPMALGFRL